MANEQVIVEPRGKKSGAWTIKGSNPPPPAKNGIDVFHGKSAHPDNRVKHA